MGNNSSVHDNYEKVYIYRQWSQFIESCCVREENAYISTADLCALFANYMRDHPDPKLADTNWIGLAWDYIDSLLKLSKLPRTPGYVSFGDKINTTLVLGLSVVRFQEKK